MQARSLHNISMSIIALFALNACAPKASVSARKEGVTAQNGTANNGTTQNGSVNNGTVNNGTVDDRTADRARNPEKPSTKPPRKQDSASNNPIVDNNQVEPADESPEASRNDSCYKGSEFICKVEALITKKTNAYRVGRGLQPVENDAKIAFVSRDWSQKQANRGMISHSGFPSARAALYAQEFNVRTSLRGENVAMFSGMGSGVESDEEAERVAQRFAVMWWNSAGHRANMLGRGHTVLGNGVYKTRNGYYATQIFN